VCKSGLLEVDKSVFEKPKSKNFKKRAEPMMGAAREGGI